MRAPTLTEFLDLVAIPAAGSCNGFPYDLQQNHRLFTTWLTDTTDVQRAALWLLLKRSMLCGCAIYFTATEKDKGFRVGIRDVRANEAETVLALFRFPDDEEPWFDINKCKIQGSHIPARLQLKLFSEDGEAFSLAAQEFADDLGRLAPRGAIIARLLDDGQSYEHIEWRRRMAHRLPCSHPVAGLIGGSAEAAWRDAWRASPMATLA